LDIDVARAGADAGDEGRACRKGDVEAGVPELEAGPLKRETRGDLCESVCGVVGPESAETAEVEGAASGVEEDVVAVAEMVDILGAALCEGTRCSRREVIWCASGPCVQSRVFVGDAATDGGLEFAALAAFADERPDDAPATEPERERFGDAEPLASVQPSSCSSPSPSVPRSKCTLMRCNFWCCTLV